jgi:molybdopterin biosynthesis enzyme
MSGAGGMKPFKDLVDYETAKSIIMTNTREMTRTEDVPLNQSAGRVIAVEVKAPISVPGFKRAAMDGYAVLAENT